VTVRHLLAVLAIVGCRHQAPVLPTLQVPVPPLPTESPWVGTLAAARTAADSGRFGVADSILAAFEQSGAPSSEMNESAFWRAMLRADPRNPAFTPADARAQLEAYLTRPEPRRRTEATVMLHLLAVSDSLHAAQSAQRSASEAHDRAREEELQKLRDDLQRTQAELDRIKRRLGPPKPL
jgi:hypothetical protein